MAGALCDRVTDHLLRTGTDDTPCVLYIGAGTRSHGALPIELPSTGPAHRTVVLQFGDSTGYDTPATGAGGERLSVEDGQVVGATAAPLPVVNSEAFYTDGPMGRLLDHVIDKCHGAIVLLCSDSTETSTTTPPAFRYLHLARAVYQRTTRHKWSSVPDGSAGIYMRAVTLFAGVDVHNAASGPGYSLIYPAEDACTRVYIESLNDFTLRLDFERLWIYVPCSQARDPRDIACTALERGERLDGRRHAPSPAVTASDVLADVRALANRIALLRSEDPNVGNAAAVDKALATIRAALVDGPAGMPRPELTEGSRTRPQKTSKPRKGRSTK